MNYYSYMYLIGMSISFSLVGMQQAPGKLPADFIPQLRVAAQENWCTETRKVIQERPHLPTAIIFNRYLDGFVVKAQELYRPSVTIAALAAQVGACYPTQREYEIIMQGQSKKGVFAWIQSRLSFAPKEPVCEKWKNGIKQLEFTLAAEIKGTIPTPQATPQS